MTARAASGPSRLIWPATLALSLGAHAGLALWLMQAPLGQVPGPGVEAIEVVLVAAEPAPAPMDDPAPLDQPQPDPLPSPQPVDLPEDVAPAQPPDAPDLAEVAAPDALPALALPEVLADTAPIVTPRPRVKAETKPAPKPAAKPAKPAPKPEAKPEARAAAKPAAAAPAATARAGGGSRDSWMADARRKIERRKRYPSAARGATGTVTLAVSVAASGALSGVSVAGSSGNAALDEAAASAVRRAAPFKPSASGYNFTVPMVFNRK